MDVGYKILAFLKFEISLKLTTFYLFFIAQLEHVDEAYCVLSVRNKYDDIQRLVNNFQLTPHATMR